MAKEQLFATGTIVSADFLNNRQEIESAMSWGVRVEKQTATVLQIPVAKDGTPSGQTSVLINGLPRFQTTTETLSFTSGQAAGAYDIYILAGSGPGFDMAAVPAGGAAPANSRLVAQVDWNGSSDITAIRNLVDGVSGHGYLHRAGGPDALPTAAAVTLTANTTNTEGASLSYARADHTHAIDASVAQLDAANVWTAQQTFRVAPLVDAGSGTAAATVSMTGRNAGAATNGYIQVGSGGGMVLNTDTGGMTFRLAGTMAAELGSAYLNIAAGGQYRIGGTALAASNLSNGTTGSGAVVLATGPTVAGPTLTGTALFSVLRASNTEGAYLTTNTSGAIYGANGTGAYPFASTDVGNFIIQARTDAARDILLVTGTTPTARMRINRDGSIGVNATPGSNDFFLISTNDPARRPLTVQTAAAQSDHAFLVVDSTNANLFAVGSGGGFTAAGRSEINSGEGLRLWGATGGTAVSVKTAAEAEARLTITHGGGLAWGGGVTGTDTNLYRGGPDVLQTDDTFNAVGNLRANFGLAGQVNIFAGTGGTGGLSFGLAGDTNLYRAAADTLRTDDDLLARLLAARPAGAVNTAFNSLIGTEANPRFRVAGDGLHEWGSGAAVADTNLYRNVADTLRTDDAFQAAVRIDVTDVGAAGNSAIRAKVTGNAFYAIDIYGDGHIRWGSGAAAWDTNLYRSAANVLKTDDTFQAADLQVGTTSIDLPNVAHLNVGEQVAVGWNFQGGLTAKASGATASIGFQAGTSTNPGYIQWHNTSGTRLGYMGFDNVHLDLRPENGAELRIVQAGYTALGAEKHHTRFFQTTQTFTTPPPTQRSVVVDAPTYAATAAAQVGGNTIATAATLAIAGPPAPGANMTITESYALWVQGGATRFDGGVLSETLSPSAASRGYFKIAAGSNSLRQGQSGRLEVWNRLSVDNNSAFGSFVDPPAGGIHASGAIWAYGGAVDIRGAGEAKLDLHDTTAAVDLKRARIRTGGAVTAIQTVNDAYTVATSRISIDHATGQVDIGSGRLNLPVTDSQGMKFGTTARVGVDNLNQLTFMAPNPGGWRWFDGTNSVQRMTLAGDGNLTLTANLDVGATSRIRQGSTNSLGFGAWHGIQLYGAATTKGVYLGSTNYAIKYEQPGDVPYAVFRADDGSTVETLRIGRGAIGFLGAAATVRNATSFTNGAALGTAQYDLPAGFTMNQLASYVLTLIKHLGSTNGYGLVAAGY